MMIFPSSTSKLQVNNSAIQQVIHCASMKERNQLANPYLFEMHLREEAADRITTSEQKTCEALAWFPMLLEILVQCRLLHTLCLLCSGFLLHFSMSFIWRSVALVFANSLAIFTYLSCLFSWSIRRFSLSHSVLCAFFVCPSHMLPLNHSCIHSIIGAPSFPS